MLLTCSTTVCPELPLKEALAFVRQAGFSRIELFRTHTESTPVHPDLSVRMVRQYLQEAEIELSGFNIRNLTGRKADSDERNPAYNLRQLEWDINLARALGLSTVNLKGGARTDEAMEDLREGLPKLLERFADITFNLGNHLDNRLQGLTDYQTALEGLDERVQVLMDTGPLLATGQDIMAFAQALAGRIGLVHLRDQQGGKPVPFGQGDLPFEPLLRLLHEAGYQGYLVIELEEVDWDQPLAAASAARHYTEELLARIKT
ncbi:MAG: TIM barrel protein [Candidatus Latescibacteria bacterium]|nr:TIM barrel protein [Candidatus Latescibacterota bacterium]